MAGLVIKPKIVIQKGSAFVYNPDTFEQYKRENFIEVETPEEMMALFEGKKLLVMDTEDRPLPIDSRDIQLPHVRRWIGSGKKANPVDMPFIISIGDGEIFASMFDMDFEHNCPKIQKLKAWLEDKYNFDTIWHNAKFDRMMLSNINIGLGGKIYDTVQLTKLVNENRPSFALRDVSLEHGGIEDFEHMVDLYKKTHKIQDYSKMPRELLIQYANADIYNCWVTFQAEFPKLKEDELEELYENELIISMMAFDMEKIGMHANSNYEGMLKAELQQRKDDAERLVYDMAGGIFNMNSGAQLHKVMLKLGVPESSFSFSPKGNVKMDKIEMEKFETRGVPIVTSVLAYKQAEKLLTTYATGIYSQADAEGNVHCSINTAEATTGRMSITKPALQTLPKKDTSIRSIFEPRPGFDMYTFDLDQVEYRIYAHYSNDETLCQMIKDGYDVHSATAAIIFDKLIEEITPAERSKAKTVNFALVFGVGVAHLAELLTTKEHVCTQSEASKTKADYFYKLPSARPFIENVQAVTRQRGYIRNWFKRRRRLSKNDCFKAPNALIQGCAADYIKFKSTRIYKFLRMNRYKSRMLLWVHDEIIFEIHEDEKFLIPILRALMSDWTTFRTFITAGCEECSPNWGHKVDRNDVGFCELSEQEIKDIDNYNIWEDGGLCG